MTAVDERGPGKTPRTVAEDLHELGDMAKEMVREKAGQVRAGAAEYATQSCQKVRNMEQSIEQYIREQPVKSLLIAMGVGLIVGSVSMAIGRASMRH